ncbi:MAG: hypothetical protein WCD79_14550 [Chthoniobacteraceae bacterium]
MAVAAALSTFCASITLLLHIHQTLHLDVLSPSFRRTLLLPHDVAEIVSMAFYCFGFFTLVRHVRLSSGPTRNLIDEN